MNNIITVDDCSVEIEEIGRRAYINTAKGREELRADCDLFARPDLYNDVMKIWGDRPTLEDYAEPEKTLAEQITDKLNDLENAFNARVSGSFISSLGYPMQFDRSDTLAVEGAVQLLRATGAEAGYLTDAEDVTHYDVPLATMEAVKVEMLAAYAACHARKQELRAAINAAQNEEELNAIEITWPV